MTKFPALYMKFPFQFNVLLKYFSDTWRCIFVLDPWFAGSSNQGVNKWRFLLQSLEDLDQGLRKVNSRLFVVRGQPADALPNLFKQWNTNYLVSHFEHSISYSRFQINYVMLDLKPFNFYQDIHIELFYWL